MASIPLPALNVQPPQVQNPLQGFRDFMAIKSQQQEQQVRAQQLQAGQQEMQQRQQAIKDQQAVTAAMKSADPTSPTFYDDLQKGVLDNGGSATAALGVQQHGLTIKKTVSDIAAQDAATGEKKLKTFIDTHQALGDSLESLADPKVVPDEQLHQAALGKLDELTKAGIIPQPAAQGLAAKINSTPDPAELRALIDQSAKASLGAKAVAQQAQEAAKTAESTAKAREENAGAAQKEAQTTFAAGAGVPPGMSPDETSLVSYMRNVPGARPDKYPAWKAEQEAKATEPYKLELAKAEVSAHQAVQGMAVPVYAYNPATGLKTLMNRTDAIQGGAKIITPVNETQVANDTQLINRLDTVKQKIDRYQAAFQKPISERDRGNLAALLDKNELRLGAFGTEIPAARFDAVMNRENLKNLSPNARDLLITYRDAAEAMIGYQRVLSGSGRASDKAMELNIKTLADPAIGDQDFANRGFANFKQNLDTAGRGLPIIPGVNDGRAATPQGGGNSGWGSQFGGVPHQ